MATRFILFLFLSILCFSTTRAAQTEYLAPGWNLITVHADTEPVALEAFLDEKFGEDWRLAWYYDGSYSYLFNGTAPDALASFQTIDTVPNRSAIWVQMLGIIPYTFEPPSAPEPIILPGRDWTFAGTRSPYPLNLSSLRSTGVMTSGGTTMPLEQVCMYQGEWVCDGASDGSSYSGMLSPAQGVILQRSVVSTPIESASVGLIPVLTRSGLERIRLRTDYPEAVLEFGNQENSYLSIHGHQALVFNDAGLESQSYQILLTGCNIKEFTKEVTSGDLLILARCGSDYKMFRHIFSSLETLEFGNVFDSYSNVYGSFYSDDSHSWFLSRNLNKNTNEFEVLLLQIHAESVSSFILSEENLVPAGVSKKTSGKTFIYLWSSSDRKVSEYDIVDGGLTLLKEYHFPSLTNYFTELFVFTHNSETYLFRTDIKKLFKLGSNVVETVSDLDFLGVGTRWSFRTLYFEGKQKFLNIETDNCMNFYNLSQPNWWESQPFKYCDQIRYNYFTSFIKADGRIGITGGGAYDYSNPGSSFFSQIDLLDPQGRGVEVSAFPNYTFGTGKILAMPIIHGTFDSAKVCLSTPKSCFHLKDQVLSLSPDFSNTSVVKVDLLINQINSGSKAYPTTFHRKHIESDRISNLDWYERYSNNYKSFQITSDLKDTGIPDKRIIYIFKNKKLGTQLGYNGSVLKLKDGFLMGQHVAPDMSSDTVFEDSGKLFSLNGKNQYYPKYKLEVYDSMSKIQFTSGVYFDHFDIRPGCTSDSLLAFEANIYSMNPNEFPKVYKISTSDYSYTLLTTNPQFVGLGLAAYATCLDNQIYILSQDSSSGIHFTRIDSNAASIVTTMFKNPVINSVATLSSADIFVQKRGEFVDLMYQSSFKKWVHRFDQSLSEVGQRQFQSPYKASANLNPGGDSAFCTLPGGDGAQSTLVRYSATVQSSLASDMTTIQIRGRCDDLYGSSNQTVVASNSIEVFNFNQSLFFFSTKLSYLDENLNYIYKLPAWVNGKLNGENLDLSYVYYPDATMVNLEVWDSTGASFIETISLNVSSETTSIPWNYGKNARIRMIQSNGVYTSPLVAPNTIE